MASAGGMTILIILFVEEEKNSKLLIFVQKISDWVASNIDIFKFEIFNSLIKSSVLWLIEFFEPSSLIAVNEPLCLRSFNLKVSSIFIANIVGSGSLGKKAAPDILRDEFAKADPWSAILTSSTESNAAWEWLNGTNQKFEGLEGEWYGNEMKTDGSGEYTDRATKQRSALKDALTQYTINTNIPKHQNDEFNVLRSRSSKEKTPDKPTGKGGLGNKNSADYSTLKGFNSKILEWDERKN